MTVAVEATTSDEEDTSVSATFDISFDPGTGDNMVIVATHYVCTTDETSDAVTLDPGGGDEAEFTALNATIQAEFVRLRPWILKDADIVHASDTYRFTCNAATAQTGGLASFTGVDQTTTTENFGSVSQTTPQAQPPDDLDITTSTGDMVVGAQIVPGVTSTWGTEVTGLPVSTNSWWCMMAYATHASTVNVLWGYSGTQSYAKWGVNLIAAIVDAVFDQVSFRFRDDDGVLTEPPVA